MSIELQEAKHKLDILEHLADKPELIITDLFTLETDGDNFLLQININGKYILDYLVEYLKKIEVFKNTKLRLSSYDLVVEVSPLEFRGERNIRTIYSNDVIMNIYPSNRTFEFCNRCIDNYVSVMNEKYELKHYELGDFWKKYEDYTLKKRLKEAFSSLTNKNKKVRIRISDFLSFLFVSKKTINKALDREYKRVDERNQSCEEQYYRNVTMQDFYKEKAPNHISEIKSKQTEIANYLIGLGYTEKIRQSYGFN